MTTDELALRHGPLRATVDPVGASLCSFRADEVALIRELPATTRRAMYDGAILAPWIGRLAGGTYTFQGRTHRVPIDEPERGTALHGLVATRAWDVVQHTNTSLTLRIRLALPTGYPFDLDLTATYLLDDPGLRVELLAVNRGSDAAPYGCAIHPYLSPGSGGVDDWSLQLPSDTYLRMDPRLLVPTHEAPTSDTPFDFRQPTPLAGLEIDNTFTGLSRDADGVTAATVRNSGGSGVTLTWDRTLPWVQVYTSDHPSPAVHRTGIAIEPATCPPNAFVTGRDLIVLDPGEQHLARWHLAAC
ncbi:aldose 1-epimerase family protein [Haloechinothrix halophila]|uniref:aldose 1-epimerase family protein n=1 Tax=Haloechinothrix halophila TaxID=1069073 RepID=UPI0004253EB7|nr:aldose 1-epimerase family protein [Haloechinothrix halophila]